MCRSKRGAGKHVTLPAKSTQRDELAAGGQPRLATGEQIRLSAHTVPPPA